MNLRIRPFHEDDLNAVIQITLLAFEPVFLSFEKILGPEIYAILYPDWHKIQIQGVKNLMNNEKFHFWIADVDGKVVGYIAFEFYEDKTGEVQLLAVHPDYQNHGVGTELNILALRMMKEAGMKLAIVGTGGDSSHAAARRSYEKAGYTGLPLVRYYKDL